MQRETVCLLWGGGRGAEGVGDSSLVTAAPSGQTRAQFHHRRDNAHIHAAEVEGEFFHIFIRRPTPPGSPHFDRTLRGTCRFRAASRKL